MTRALQRSFFGLGSVMLLLLVGATYQGVTTALERRAFPRPGQMVDVGGHQLHLHCTGEGSPTVVLEAPAMGMSAAWGWVQPAVARDTRVCSYDRLGLGWSERGEKPFAPMDVPDDLHALLERAGERPPFVIVGQDLGAAFATLFAQRFGDETAALILIDQPASATAPPDWPPFVGLSPWLARFGILRATRTLSRRARGLPAPSAGALGAFLNRPDHLTEAAAELSRWKEAEEAARAPVRAGLPVTRVDTADTDGTALLTSESKAEPVVTAILDAVSAVRRAQ